MIFGTCGRAGDQVIRKSRGMQKKANAEEEDSPRVRYFLHPSRRPLAHAGFLDRPYLSRRRHLRRAGAHFRARLHRHAVLRRRHRDPRYLGRGARRSSALGHRLAASRHEPGHHLHVTRHQARRVWPDLRFDVHAPVLRCASVQLARSRHQRPYRLQRDRVEPQCRCGELRLRRADGARHALQPHGGVHRRLPRAMGQRRTGRLQVGPRVRALSATRTKSAPSITPDNSSRCAGRSTASRRHSVIRC